MKNSDIEFELAVHVFVWFGDVADEDLYCSFEVGILSPLDAELTHDLSA